MQLIPTSLPGTFEIKPFFAKDERGTFVKTFHAEHFATAGLALEWREEFYSISRKGVIRGMHFQTPPHDHEKLVYCMQGRVLDVVVDLRKKSPTFGRHIALELDSLKGHGLLVPKGMAHGFLALTQDVIMAYKVTTAYSPESDAGIRWDSIGVDWKVDEPTISARDRRHPTFAMFESPF
jgi:dTDP-4-dehydrorhamnose 3,5-epimerase